MERFECTECGDIYDRAAELAPLGEVANIARLPGHDDLLQLCPVDLCLTSSEIPAYTAYTDIRLAGEPEPPA